MSVHIVLHMYRDAMYVGASQVIVSLIVLQVLPVETQAACLQQESVRRQTLRELAEGGLLFVRSVDLFGDDESTRRRAGGAQSWL